MTAPTVDPHAIRPIRLRLLTLENNLVLAPMAGVSNLPFRLIAREAGAALVFSETLSAKGLLDGGRKTWRMLETSPREAPVAFQLFGSEPELLGEASRQLEDAGVEWLDLNVGCPVKKFIKNGAGSALLRDLPRAAAIVRAMRAELLGHPLGEDARGLGRELDQRAGVRAHRRGRGRRALQRARAHP